MDVRYEAYCLVDPVFYDSPERAGAEHRSGADFARLVTLPDGWSLESDGVWTHCVPDSVELPPQGWKIHASTTPDTAEQLLQAIAAYCVDSGLPFKFLANRMVLFTQNSKYAGRESSGKFVTVYPRDVAQLHDTLLALDRRVGGMPGPYILSDLRWNEGPLYVRYGGFAKRYTVDERGRRVPAIERPDGRLEPDRREPRFVVPDWLPVPGFLTGTAQRRTDAGQPSEFPYDVLQALHFSNAGGIYLVRRRTDGAELVLKEARPHAGLDMEDQDAVARLHREHRALGDLRGVPGVPRALQHHTLGGHSFLAMERVSGTPLGNWLASHYPLITGRSGAADRRAYQASAHRILARLHRLLGDLHARGYAYRDLHPGNVFVGDDLDVSLIDFEMAVPAEGAGPQPLAAPGFLAPQSTRGADVDRYAFAAVALYAFAPLTSLLSLCPSKVDTVLAFAREHFHIEQWLVDEIVERLRPPAGAPARLRPPPVALRFDQADAPWSRQSAALVAAIHAAATPQRADRLFPGDIDQFHHGGGGLAWGAAGVLDALHAAGERDLDGYVDWLWRHVRAPGPPRPGLYDGLAGVGHALANLGRDDLAAQCLEVSAAAVPSLSGVKLFDGLAGIGLACLDFHRRTAEPRWWDTGVAAAQATADAIDAGTLTGDRTGSPPRHRVEAGNAVENFHAGLLYGWTGPALFMVRMYEVTGEARWLAAARQALARDLDQCEALPDGTLQVRNGPRVLPYLATGSAGVALGCDLLLRHLPDERVAAAVDPLCRAAAVEFCLGSGLFNGRAGLVYILHRLRPRLRWPDAGDRLAAGVRALNLHALADEHGLLFPGDQNFRAATDLATGSAGVLRLLTVLSGRQHDVLPFVGPEPWTPAATGSLAGAAGRE